VEIFALVGLATIVLALWHDVRTWWRRRKAAARR
jgi:hypothetical protein